VTDPSAGELLSRLSDELTRLVRDELRSAQLEMSGKAKKLSVGAGMLGAAGLLGWYGVATLVTTAILALSLVVSAWLAALIVAVVLLAIAGTATLLGRKRIQAAAPPVPSMTVKSVQRDVDTLRHAHDPRSGQGPALTLDSRSAIHD